ncbi:MAG: S-adenosylmethionine decarboxylase [Blastocatellia bacterium]
MNVGTEWMIDAHGCNAADLADLAVGRGLCERIIRELDLKVIGDGQWHQFPAPGGVTGLYLLSESHLACHTYPELGVATFNLYCCRPRPRWPWEARLQEMLGATRVIVRLITRNADGENATPTISSASEAPATDRSVALEVANS